MSNHFPCEIRSHVDLGTAPSVTTPAVTVVRPLLKVKMALHLQLRCHKDLQLCVRAKLLMSIALQRNNANKRHATRHKRHAALRALLCPGVDLLPQLELKASHDHQAQVLIQLSSEAAL